jgi:hypothetical protein
VAASQELGQSFRFEEIEELLDPAAARQPDVEFDQPELGSIGKSGSCEIETVVSATPLKVLGTEKAKCSARVVRHHDARSIHFQLDREAPVQEKRNLISAADRQLLGKLDGGACQACCANEYQDSPLQQDQEGLMNR